MAGAAEGLDLATTGLQEAGGRVVGGEEKNEQGGV